MGKSKSKTFWTLAGVAFGALNPGAFGIVGSQAAIQGALYGASLASTIWTALHQDTDNSYSFDAVQNTVDSESMIPIIYGKRLFGGIQTYHRASSDLQSLTKDLIFCEGEINGVTGVTANCLLISSGVLFSIQNIAYTDATVAVNGDYLNLYANGTTTTIHLRTADDLEDLQTNPQECYTQELISYIEKLGCGWRITDNAGVDTDPCEIYEFSATNCYNNPVSCSMDGLDDCSYTFSNGASDQDPPSNYKVVGGYKNCAWVRASLTISDDLTGSDPTVAAIVKGKKVYDPRDGSTVWSDNPALCLRDYITNKRYGMGRWITEDMIDDDSFSEVADYCETQISYYDAYGIEVTEQRYKLNFVIAEQKKHIENVQDMLAAFGGFLVFSGDQVSLRIEKAESVSYAFDESNIKIKSVKFEYEELDNRPNRYTIKYYDPGQNWVGIKVLVNDIGDQKVKSKIINKDVDLLGCTSQGQALRLGRIYKAINRLCPGVVTFSTATMAMHLQPGDIITLTFGVLDAAPFRILEISENKGLWTIKAQQYNSSIYDDTLDSQISIGNYTTVSSPYTETVPNVSDVSTSQDYYIQKDGTVISTLTVNYTLPTYTNFSRVKVYYSIDGGSTYTLAGYTTDATYTFSNVIVGDSYIVQLKVENTVQRVSSGIITDAVTITGKNVAPDSVSDFAATETAGGFNLTWTANDENDISGYSIWQGTDNAGIDACTLIADTLSSTSLFVSISTATTYIFYIKAVDTSGNYSDTASVTATYTLPDSVTGFAAASSNSYINFSWDKVSGTDVRYELRRGASWSSGIKLTLTLSTSYSLHSPGSSSYIYWIKSVDQYGNYCADAVYYDLSVVLEDDRNIIDTINQVTNSWSGVKLNTVAESELLRLKSGEVYKGYHIVDVDLGESCTARNWINYDFVAVEDVEIDWEDATFTWDSGDAAVEWLATGDSSSMSVANKIARFTGYDSTVIESFSLDNTLVGDVASTDATESTGVTYDEGTFRNGAYISDCTRVSWSVSIPEAFNLVFYVRVSETMDYSVIYATLEGTAGKLTVGYSYADGYFYLKDSSGNLNTVTCDYDSVDCLCFGIVQTSTERRLYVMSIIANDSGSSTESYEPIGTFTTLRLYGD